MWNIEFTLRGWNSINIGKHYSMAMCPWNCDWTSLTQSFPLPFCLVWQRSLCQQLSFPNWTSWGGECYVQLLVGFLSSMVTGMMRCQEWIKNCRTHIEFIQRNHGLKGFWGANSVLRERSHKWIIGQFFVQHGNPVIFMKETFMCNLVGAQVVHRSDGMINAGFFSEHVFHSSWTTAARHGAQ